jgi:hypothetical protein
MKNSKKNRKNQQVYSEKPVRTLVFQQESSDFYIFVGIFYTNKFIQNREQRRGVLDILINWKYA